MPTYSFDFRKTTPATGGGRQDYIKPGKYRFKVSDYGDKQSREGKEMHTFTSTVISKGEMSGKTIVDRFAMPKTARESQYPVERLLSFFLSLGSKNAQGKKMTLDPKKLIGKEFTAEITDERREMQTVGDTTYPARVVSAINRYIFGDDDESDDDDDDDDDETEDEDTDEEEDEEDEDSDEDSDNDEDEDEDEEEEEEDEAPPKKSSKKAPAEPAAKAKAPPAKAGKKSSKKSNDDDDFPFDD